METIIAVAAVDGAAAEDIAEKPMETAAQPFTEGVLPPDGGENRVSQHTKGRINAVAVFNGNAGKDHAAHKFAVAV